MFLTCLLFLSFNLYASCFPGASLLEHLTKDNPCQGTTENGFGDSIFDDEYGFVTHNTTGDGESVSRCWSLEFDEEIKVLQIAFYHYAITSDETCIQVYSGNTTINASNDLLGTFCGAVRPPFMNVFVSPAIILYHTNNTTTGQSFEAVFNVVDADGQCGGLLTEPEGQITSVDRDGNGLYDAYLKCITIITAPEDFVIEITFIDFNLSSYYDCLQDVVIVRDTRMYHGDYCGDEIPPKITTKTNVVRVIFWSTFIDPLETNTRSGFLARYRFLYVEPERTVRCHYQLHETLGYIEYFADGDTGSFNCTWIIQAGQDKIIQHALTHLDIPTRQPRRQCTDNHLKIKATGLNRIYCGSELPPLVETTHSPLTLTLQLTQKEVGAGFKAVYTFVDRSEPCGKILTETPWQIQQPSEPTTYSPYEGSRYYYGIDLDCIWIIIAPNHNQIALEFSQLDIEGQYPCLFDFIQIIGSYYVNGTNVFPRICGDEMPGKIVSPANIMYVRFVADAFYSRKGFYINGEFKHESVQPCGGELSESVDTFGLMLNELRMGSMTACHWVINNEQKQTLELKIFRMHLPDEDTCTSAFIELYDESGAVGKFCGIGAQPVQLFTATQLHVYFISKDKYPGFGFEATYSISDGMYTNQSRFLTLDGPQFFKIPDIYTDSVGTYDHMLDLQWTIILEPGKIVQLFFTVFDIENSKDCIYDRLKVFDGSTSEARLLGTYCGTTAPKKIRSTSNVLFVTFFADGTRNGNGFHISFSQADEFAWRQWPDADRAYSIPKSVYGCPDQTKNQWIEGYMDFRNKLSERAVLLEESLGPITPEHNLFTIGPFQSDGFRLSFCSKKKRSGLKEVNRDAEWPRGNYAIFHHTWGCPEGFFWSYDVFEFPFKFNIIVEGLVPAFAHTLAKTEWELDTLRFEMCVKQSDIDVMTFASDLRPPFMVISPEFAMNHTAHPLRQLNRNYAGDSMLHYNTSMKAAEESFSIGSYVYMYYDGGDQAVFDLFTFWIILPKEPRLLFLEQQDPEIIEPSTFALGLPDYSEDNLLLIYDLGQIVSITGIRLIQNQGFSVKDNDGSNLNIPSIMVSNNKLNFEYKGAFLCLPFELRNNLSITVYCVNDPHIMSTRYVALKAVPGANSIFEGLLEGSWSIWLLSDKEPLRCGQTLGMESGYIEDFQINVTSEDPLFLKNSGRPGDTGWCYNDEDSEPRFQIDLLYPTWIEGVLVDPMFILRKTLTRVEAYFSIDKYADPYHYEVKKLLRLTKEDTLYTLYPNPVLARTVSFGVNRNEQDEGETATRCYKFELYGCRRSGLKNMNCANYNATETYKSREMLVNYFFHRSDSSLHNTTLSECTAECRLRKYRCAVAVLMDQSCDRYLSSASYSYGSVLAVGKNTRTAMQICPTARNFKTTAYIIGGLSWDNVTTVVQQPGFIVSHDYPFLYSSGEIWLWDIHFDLSTNNHIIVYNASFYKHKEFLRTDDYTFRFSDKLDRLYIAKGSFDLNLVFSEDPIHKSSGLIAVLDTESGHVVPHYIAEPGNMRLIWRTVVQVKDSKDTRAVGFRLLAYTDDEPICKSSATVCEMFKASLSSKSFIGEYSSYTENWSIKADQKRFIVIEFREFDIGCGSGSRLEIESTSELMRRFCNQNKPIHSVRSSHSSLVVRFNFEKRDSYLIEGFRAVYEFQARDDAILPHPSLEEPVSVPHHEDGLQNALKVCSAQFKKCYILLDGLNQRNDYTMPSWFYASTSICENNDWTLVSLHSKLEQEFVVSMLLNRLNYTNMEYTYIGLRREVSINTVYTWTDNTSLTYTAWKKNEPPFSVSYSCTRMSLKMAEDSEWESCECDTPAATVAVCQHPWNDVASDKNFNRSERIPDFVPFKLVFNPLSMFSCANGEIISLLGRCDGLPDCGDISDEQNCTNSTDGCTLLQYQCRDGHQCISVNQMCDFYPDCQDSSDENCYFSQCNEATEFTCDNQRCINTSFRCDGKDDCRDNSDEENCVEYNCFRRSFPCSSSQCISFSYVCDGVQDCWNGQDELNCQFPQRCSDWWNAGYQYNDVYNIGGIDVECDFGNIKTDIRIVSKFHHTDFERLLSRVSNFSYTSQDSLRHLINDNDCYQDVDQLCHSWVQELYKWDASISKLTNESDWNWSRIHPCFCVRHSASLSNHQAGTNIRFVYQDCDGNDLPLLPGAAYHVMVNQSDLYGYIQSMQLKRGHVFEINRLKLAVHPMRCYSDFVNITSKLACGHGFSANAENKCLYQLDVFGHIIGCRSLQHLQNCEEFECPVDFYKCPDSFCIEKQFVCDGVPQCENGEDEQRCEVFSCKSQYRCLQSKICLPEKYICDGYPQCPLEDDEKLCNFSCPAKCSCQGFGVNCTRAFPSGVNSTINISPATRLLDVSNNPGIYHYLSLDSANVRNLIYLNISSCRITALSVSVFENFWNLRNLDLSHNLIGKISSGLFLSIQKLEKLSLSFNLEILTIETEAFRGLDSIHHLEFESLQVDLLSKAAFAFLDLDILDLSGNAISKIDNNAFETLRTKRLYLNGTDIHTFGSDLFKGLEQVDFLITDDFKFCCFRPYYLTAENCLPQQNEFSSCDDLMRNGILRSFIWIIGVFALIGNAASIFYHIQFDRQRLKLGYGIFVTNLAISDFVMGLYLIIIAVTDMVYRGEYILHDEAWRNSVLCNLAGVFALLSSEASIFFVCLITLDRILVIKYPFSQNRFTTRPSVKVSIIAWIIAIVLSVIPLIFTSYFKNEFFSKSGVCLALPLTREKGSGWLYSVLIFIVFNLITFLLIAWGQWLIYAEVSSDKRPMAKSAESRKKELRVARNLLLVVLTDFLCWFPIGLLGILAITGTAIPGDVYAWTAVFILPFNSALNPFLYTLSAILGKKTMVPDTEEHEKTLTFLKTEVEDIFDVWQQPDICNLPHCNLPPMGYVSILNRELNLRECIEIARRTVVSLTKLHHFGIAQKDLSLEDIYLRRSKGRCDVILNCHPQLGNNQKIKAENIKSVGELIRKLLDTNKSA